MKLHSEMTADGGDAGGGGAPAESGESSGTVASANSGDWLASVPEDWHQQLLGPDADESRINTLQRTPDLKTLATRFVDAQDQIRRGQIEPLQPPGEGATAEQWVEYRERIGIPGEPAEYEQSLDAGLALGDEDKAILDRVFEAAHSNNVPAAAMSPMVSAFLQARESAIETEMTKQEQYRADATAALKSTWGGGFQQNVNMIKSVLIDSLPEALRESFEHAVLPDGRKVFNSPEVMVAMADWARRINPAATVVPNSGNPAKDMNSEIAELEGRMGDDDWFKDNAAQQRYRDLISARAAMNGEQLDDDEYDDH